MELRVDHEPGSTAADQQYRAWEELFSGQDYERRVIALSELGIDLRELPADVRRSVGLLTQAEIGTRLVCAQYGLSKSEDGDVLALVLRLARSLAQRRGRGDMEVAQNFTTASAILLREWRLPPPEIERWLTAIELLARTERPVWNDSEVRVAAQSQPLAVAVRCVAHGRGDLRHLVRLFEVGTALDWLVLDMKRLFEDNPKLSHTAPISDFLAYRLPSVDASGTSRMMRCVSLIDAYARELDTYLSVGDPSDVPSFVVEHFRPVLVLTQVVATGLQSKGVL